MGIRWGLWRALVRVGPLLLSLVMPAAGAADAAPLGRLPGTLRPLAYRLELRILPDEEKFSGATAVDVELNAPAEVIYLHGNELEVESATLTTAGGETLPARYEQLDPSGVARLTFATRAPAGRSTLRFRYTAKFGRPGEGLYRSEAGGEAYAFTQFEPIDARRMFPGLDEPGFKTPFEVSVITRSANTVVGNAPVQSEEPAGEGLKRVVLEKTLPLPTYLVALAVGPLDVVEAPALPPNDVRNRPLPLRGVATRGKGARLRFALDNTAAIVSYLERYFDRPFPYPKLDLITSPDFGGGMENAGAIIYGDARLLLPDDPSPEARRGFGGIHAHELAHQWFGDLVTPKWWDDIWLNESFANWMGFKAGHAWQPALGLDIVPALQTPPAMDLDARIAARRIRNPVERNADIGSAFDGITYLKGGAVLGMFEAWLGEEAFRAGIRTHMRRFANGVADVEDFMASLAQGSGRADVVPAFRSFIDQAGVPLASVEMTCDGAVAKLTVKQSRYLPLGSRGDARRSWQLPLCIRYGAGTTLTKQCALVSATETTLPLEAPGCPAFVMPNADGAGYYRFALDDPGWRALVANLGQLTEPEALALADSLSAAYQANRLSTTAFLDAVTAIAGSPMPQVALAPDGDLIRMRNDLAPAAVRDNVRALMRRLYRPRLNALGPAPAVTPSAASGRQVELALFRNNLLRFLALEADDRELRASLAADAGRYIRLGQDGVGLDESAVPAALVETALRAGVQDKGLPFVERLIERMLASEDVQFRSEAAVALANTDEPAVASRVRALLLDPRLRGREPTSMAFALAARPSQRRATFDWFKANHEAFIGRTSHFGYRWMPRFGAGFCTLRERDEVRDFFTPLLGRLFGADRTLAETLEGIELCAALAEARRDEVGRHFAGGGGA